MFQVTLLEPAVRFVSVNSDWHRVGFRDAIRYSHVDRIWSVHVNYLLERDGIRFWHEDWDSERSIHGDVDGSIDCYWSVHVHHPLHVDGIRFRHWNSNWYGHETVNWHWNRAIHRHRHRHVFSEWHRDWDRMWNRLRHNWQRMWHRLRHWNGGCGGNKMVV